MPLGNWEGQRRDERSQETCLCGESQARCTQADISASLPAARFFRGAVLLVGIVRAAVGHHGRFYISFRTIFEEEGKEKHEKSTCTPARSRDAAERADRLRQQK